MMVLELKKKVYAAYIQLLLKVQALRRAWTEKGKSPISFSLYSHLYKWEYTVHLVS